MATAVFAETVENFQQSKRLIPESEGVHVTISVKRYTLAIRKL
jgi:hypothetical protein